MVESCSTLPSLFVFLHFCQSVKLVLCRTFDFAVLPECRSCPRISPRRCFAHIIAKSYPIQTVIQLWWCTVVVTRFWQTKRADYTEHQKSAGAWLSLQNDVLCNQLWRIKVGFCFIQLPPTEPKAWWSSSALPVYRYRVGWTDFFTMGRTFLFSCYVAAYRYTTIIQIMCYTVKIANPSHYIRNYKERKSTVTEKVLLLVRTFSEKYQRAKIILSNLGRILRINFPTTCREYKSSLPTKLVGSLKSHFCPTWTEVKNHFAAICNEVG